MKQYNNQTIVTISLLNYNQKKYLQHCLDSIINQSHQNLEIFIIDNASTDGSQETIKKLINQYSIFNIQYSKNSKNLGYAKGHNRTINKSTGQYILCLNPDIILDKDYIKNALELFQQNPKIGAITGKLYKWKFKNNIRTNTIDSCGHKILKSHRIIEWGSGQKDNEKFNRTQKVFSISGAAPIYKISALNSIKIPTKHDSKNNLQTFKNKFEWFDQSFFAYKEDIDLGWRLLHQNWENWFHPKSKAWHDRWQTGTGKSSKQTLKQRKQKSKLINQLSYRNHFFLIWKNEFAINLFIYLPYIFFYEFRKFLYILFHEPSTLKSLFQAIKMYPLTTSKRHAILKHSKIKPKKIRKYITYKPKNIRLTNLRT